MSESISCGRKTNQKGAAERSIFALAEEISTGRAHARERQRKRGGLKAICLRIPDRSITHEPVIAIAPYKSFPAPLGVLRVALITLLLCTLQAAAADSRVILMEDFEGYANSDALRAIWTGGTATLETNAPGGGKAALHDGGTPNNFSGLYARPDAEHNLLFSADIYDSATNRDKRVTVMLKHANDASLEFGYVPKSSPYQVKVSGFARTADWTPFNVLLRQVRGWHRFQAIISMTNTIVTLDLGADGKIDATLRFDGPPPENGFNRIRFGGLVDGKSLGGPMLVDNIKLVLLPTNASVTTSNATSASTVFEPQPGPPPGETDKTAPTVKSPPPSTPSAPIKAPTPPPPGAETALWWIVGALAVIIGLIGLLLLVLRRHHRSTPQPTAAWSVVKVPPSDTTRVSSEVESPNQQNPAHAELTEYAKQSLVQGLYSQRQALIETQKRAQHDIAELEARLTALHLPLQERIRAYEKRLAELEKQLDSRNDEMHELTQVTLRLMREKLEEEKARQRGESRFN
jgi:hypothetical protein